MSETVDRELAERLGAGLPRSVASLDEATAAKLVNAMDRARAQQQAELLRSRDEALRVLPRPLRGVARKVIGG